MFLTFRKLCFDKKSVRVLTGSTVVTDFTDAGLEIRGLKSAWLVGHSHDHNSNLSLSDEKDLFLSLRTCCLRLLLYQTSLKFSPFGTNVEPELVIFVGLSVEQAK